MDRKEYCDRVLAQVGRLTSDEANDLRNELAGHIEDHAEALVEHGYTEEDAAARAVELMGDPEETGKALREQYRHFWLVIVQRAARILTALLCVMIAGLIVKSSGFYGAIRDRMRVKTVRAGSVGTRRRRARAFPSAMISCALMRSPAVPSAQKCS